MHLGKTGGTAVKHALRPYLDSSDRFSIRLHPHEVRLFDLPEGDQVFFFVRDPISRFVSGFYSRWRRGRPRYNVPWTEAEARAFSHFRTANELARALSSQDDSSRKLAEEAMADIGHVSSSYWDWFGSEQYLESRLSDVFFVGLLEDLASDFRLLTLKAGLSQCLDLPTDDIHAHRNPRSLDRSLDRESRANLEHWYAQDYAFVHLVKRLRRLMP